MKNPSDAAKRLDDDEKGIAPADALRGTQSMLIVNESGLFFPDFEVGQATSQEIQEVGDIGGPAIHPAHGFVHARRRPGVYSPLQPKLGPDGRWVLFGAIGACNSYLGPLRANRLQNEGKYRRGC